MFQSMTRFLNWYCFRRWQLNLCVHVVNGCNRWAETADTGIHRGGVKASGQPPRASALATTHMKTETVTCVGLKFLFWDWNYYSTTGYKPEMLRLISWKWLRGGILHVYRPLCEEVSLFTFFRESGGKIIAYEALHDLHNRFILLVEPVDVGNHWQLPSFAVVAGQQDIVSTEASDDQLPDAWETRGLDLLSHRLKLVHFLRKCESKYAITALMWVFSTIPSFSLTKTS